MTLRSFCRANFRFSSIWSVFGGQERDHLAYHLFSCSLCGRESAGLEEQVSLWCKIKMLFEIVQYIVSLHISSGNCSRMESHTLVSLETFSCWWIHGMWAKGKWLSASQQEKAPRACGKSLSLPSWSHTKPAASGKLCLKTLATCRIQYLLLKKMHCVTSKLQEDPSTEMASYEGMKLHALPGNFSLTTDIWQVWLQH